MLVVYYWIDRVYVHQGKKIHGGFKSYNAVNNAILGLNHVASHFWIKTSGIRLYDNLRLKNRPENLTSLNQATLVYAIHWPQSPEVDCIIQSAL